jgi:PAS domain S-box-containing protein
MSQQQRDREPNSVDHATLQSMVESAGVPIVVADEDDRIAIWNRDVAELFGYDHDEFGTLRFDDLIPEPFRAVHALHVERYRAHPRFRSIDSGIVLTGRGRDGSEFPVDISLGPFEIQQCCYVMATLREHIDTTK